MIDIKEVADNADVENGNYLSNRKYYYRNYFAVPIIRIRLAQHKFDYGNHTLYKFDYENQRFSISLKISS